LAIGWRWTGGILENKPDGEIMSSQTHQVESLFVLGLEENAIDSLVHAVEHFLDDEKPTNIKYSILHLFHAVELFLKARLAKFDQNLIFKKNYPDKTINFDETIKLLKDKGVALLEQDKRDLNELKLIRNQIEHYRIQHNRNDVEDYLGRAFHFLESFLQQQLGISLKEHLDEVDENAYKTLSMAYFFYFKRMSDNGISFHPEDAPTFHYCDNCQEEAIVVPDPRTSDSSTYCFCCFSRYVVNYCPMCEGQILNYDSIDRAATHVEQPEESAWDDDSEETDWPSHWGFCENCNDRIMSSP
jgi:hypothetical protein